MKLTKSNLKQIIKEELQKTLQESDYRGRPIDGTEASNLAVATVAFIMDYIAGQGGPGPDGVQERAELAQKWLKANQQLKNMIGSGEEGTVTDENGKAALAKVKDMYFNDRELFNHFLERGKKTTVSE